MTEYTCSCMYMLYIASARRLGIHVPQDYEVLSINQAQFLKKKCVYPLQIYTSTYLYSVERRRVKRGGYICFDCFRIEFY